MADSKIMMTERDFKVITDAIVYPMILSTLEHDIKKMSDIGLKIPIIYIAQSRRIQAYIDMETPRLKAEMRDLGIKILGYEKTSDGCEYKYVCRGYQQTFPLMTDIIRTKVITKLCEMLELDLSKFGATP